MYSISGWETVNSDQAMLKRHTGNLAYWPSLANTAGWLDNKVNAGDFETNIFS